jgi:tetratricopeptide (TPR) repeat protein
VWEQRRRQIIERALDFDPHVRWKDVREITREFEILESDYALEESRAQTVAEREKQKGRIRRLHLLWMTLAVILGLAAAYGAITTANLQFAKDTIRDNAEESRKQIETRDQKIASLSKELKNTQDWKAASDANLVRAQSLVDQLITQLVQLPTDNNLQVAFSKQQLADANSYLRQSLPALEGATLTQERARAFGNLGMISLRQRNAVDAVKYLDKARIELHALISREPNNPQVNLYRQWLGRFSLLLAKMRAARGDGDTALGLFKEATENLDPGLQNNPKDRNARYEAAQAWFEYAARCRMEGQLEESDRAFNRVNAALDEAAIGASLLTEERFLLARGDLEHGMALRDAGKLKDAVDALLAGADHMATLVAASSPQNKDQALILAEAYTDLADLIARQFSARDASEAHQEAVKVLNELIRIDPDWNEVKYLLARNYGQIAGLERDMGNQSEALRRKKDAIELINEVVSGDSENRTFLFHQAKLRGELAELMAEGGKPKEALPIIQQAIENLQNLLQQLPAERQTAQRREWEIQLAILLGIQGQVNESAKLKDEARKAYGNASKQWQHLADQNKENETVKNGLDWVKNKLLKLK